MSATMFTTYLNISIHLNECLLALTISVLFLSFFRYFIILSSNSFKLLIRLHFHRWRRLPKRSLRLFPFFQEVLSIFLCILRFSRWRRICLVHFWYRRSICNLSSYDQSLIYWRTWHSSIRKKAFDRVDLNMLWNIIERRGYPKHAPDVIKRLFEDTEVNIFTGKGSCKSIKATQGVLQGCSLSPTLFNI